MIEEPELHGGAQSTHHMRGQLLSQRASRDLKDRDDHIPRSNR